jgi:hypothetical protein
MKAKVFILIMVSLSLLIRSGCDMIEEPEIGHVSINIKFVSSDRTNQQHQMKGRNTTQKTNFDRVHCRVTRKEKTAYNKDLSRKGDYFEAKITLDAESGYSIFIDCYVNNQLAYTGSRNDVTVKGDSTTEVVIEIDTSIPERPSSLKATAPSSSQIDLEWIDNSTNETYFIIEQKMSSDTTFSFLDSVPFDTTTYSSLGLDEDTNYSYRVYGYNYTGNSAYSDTATARTLLSFPNAPSNLRADVATSTEIYLTWYDNSHNEEGFHIERCLEGMNFQPIVTLEADTRSYRDTTVTGGMVYFYRAQAYNRTGNSAYSDTAWAETPITKPEAPSDLDTTYVTSNEIGLEWTDHSTNEDGFEIQRRTGTSGNYAPIASVDANTYQLTDSSLTENTTYCYLVRAYNGAGFSFPSNAICATTPQTVPDAPSDLEVRNGPSMSLILTWIDNSFNEDGFEIHRALDGNFEYLGWVSENVTSYKDEGLDEGILYCYKVCAYNGAGSSAFTDSSCAIASRYYVVGSFDTPGTALDVDVYEGYACVADGNAGISVIDVSSPEYPDEECNCSRAGTVCGIKYYGSNRAFAVDQLTIGQMTVDCCHLSDESSTPGSASDVSYSSGYAYIADGSEGLGIYHTNMLYKMGYCDTPDEAKGVALSGGYAFIADGDSGVVTIDVSDRYDPQRIGICDTPGDAQRIAYWGNHVYVADGEMGLTVVDISNPNDPILVTTVKTRGTAKDITIANDIAYVADGESGLTLMDVSNPSVPWEKGFCETPGDARGVAVYGDYAYVADGSKGLQIIYIGE